MSSLGSPGGCKRPGSTFSSPGSGKKAASSKAEPLEEFKFMVYHGGGGLQNTYSLSERPKGGIVMVGVGADPADDKKALACVFASDPTNASRLNDFLNSEVVTSTKLIRITNAEWVRGSIESSIYQFAKPFTIRIKVVAGTRFEVLQIGEDVLSWGLDKVPCSYISASGWGVFTAAFTSSDINTFNHDKAAKRTIVFDAATVRGCASLKLWTFAEDNASRFVMSDALTFDPDITSVAELKQTLFVIVSGGFKEDDEAVTVNAYGMLVPISNVTALVLARKRLCEALAANPSKGAGSSAAASMPLCPSGQRSCELKLATDPEEFLDSDGAMCVKFEVLSADDKKSFKAFVSVPVVVVELFGEELDLFGIKNVKATLEMLSGDQAEKDVAMDMLRQVTVTARVTVDDRGHIIQATKGHR